MEGFPHQKKRRGNRCAWGVRPTHTYFRDISLFVFPRDFAILIPAFHSLFLWRNSMMRHNKPAMIPIGLAWAVLLGALLACNIPGLQQHVPNENPNEDESISAEMTKEMAKRIEEVAGNSAKLTEQAGAPTATHTPPPDFKSARFYYFPDNAVFSGAASVGSLLDFCTPPYLQPSDSRSGFLTVGEFGALNGQCSGDDKKDSVQREGSLTGAYDAENHQVSFRLETRRVFSPGEGAVTALLTFEGHAEVKGNTADGVGNFDYNCTTKGEGLHCLDEQTTLQLNGTMPFQIVFSP
jgi:hypothetical protein